MPNYLQPGQVVPYQSDLAVPELPSFAKVIGQPNCIISPSGITYLPQSSFKQVYMGSQHHAIDALGIPWREKKALKKITGGEKRVRKKEARVETQADEKINNVQQSTENLSTLQSQSGTDLQELSTKKKQYRIKKSLVRNRLLAYTRTKRGYKHLYFFTVTFPKGMPESMGYRCLNTWFTSLRKQNLLRQYLWIAERQPDTGTIHFHIAVPHFMKVQHVNGIMRKILLGYALRKEIPFPVEKFAPGKYNGVDIQGHWPSGVRFKGPKIATNFAEKKKAGALTRYLTKYITKNNETFEHLAWHNSRGFSSVFYAVALTRQQVYASGIHRYLATEADKKFVRYAEFVDRVKVNGVLQERRYTDVAMCFIPWRRDAPDLFWNEVTRVNNFFQDVDDFYSQMGKKGLSNN